MNDDLNFSAEKLSPKEQEELRKKIVRQMAIYGETKLVSEICECSRRHVQATMKKYREGGIDAIKSVKMCAPLNSGKKLTAEQEKVLIAIITEKSPNGVGFKEYLWTRKLCAELVKHQFGIEMPLSTIGHYLARWGFTSQRPKKSYKQKESDVQKWLEVTYPDIVRQAEEENAEIYWVDETGIQSTSNYVKGYSPRGITPIMPVSNEHVRMNLISAINNRGKLRFHFYSGKMNQDCFKDFLKVLIKKIGEKIVIITDNLPAHHGSRLKEWLHENKEKIRLFYLPSYAPESNPVEYLNNNLKYVMARKGYYKDEKELKKMAIRVMLSFNSMKNRVSSFFDNVFVQYASI
jgi:transposase